LVRWWVVPFVLLFGCGKSGPPDGVTSADRSDGAIPLLDVKRAGAIEVDGADGEWSAAGNTGWFVSPMDGKGRPKSKVNGKASFGWDDDALYVLFVVYDGDASSPFGRADVDPHIWSKASGIELMLQPGDRADNRDYFEIQIDVAEAVWGTRFGD